MDGVYPLEGIKRLDTLGANLESAAFMAAMHRIGYTRGFEAGRLLVEFGEPDYVPEPYFPMADTRPTAERLGWAQTECRHMWGEPGSCARCEGT